EVPQLCQQDLVIGEDDVLLAAELAEERRSRNARGLGDLLDRCLVESLRTEQLERCGDDAARRFHGLMHARSLTPGERDRRRLGCSDRSSKLCSWSISRHRETFRTAAQ